MIRLLASALFASFLALASCASSPNAMKENAITHHVAPDDLAYVQTKQAIPAKSATLYVNGLGCPLCASNIDKQLARVSGVEVKNIDLSTGKVAVHFTGDKHPAPFNLAHAVEDAGFTLVKIESN